MLYCLFVLNYRNISLVDYLSVVFYVYITNYSKTVKQKNGRGYPISPTTIPLLGFYGLLQDKRTFTFNTVINIRANSSERSGIKFLSRCDQFDIETSGQERFRRTYTSFDRNHCALDD